MSEKGPDVMTDAPDYSLRERLVAALLALLADREATIKGLRRELDRKDEEP